MDTPDSTTRASILWTVLRRLVLGVFACIAMLIVWFVGMAVAGYTGLSFDPHGYGIIFGILFAAFLTPVALALWLLYRSLQRRGN